VKRGRGLIQGGRAGQVEHAGRGQARGEEQQPQQPVVRGQEVLAALGRFHVRAHDAPGGAHAGVHHADEHRVGRIVGSAGRQKEGRLVHGEGLHLVGDVQYGRARGVPGQGGAQLARVGSERPKSESRAMGRISTPSCRKSLGRSR
jgi:hypothetical protein